MPKGVHVTYDSEKHDWKVKTQGNDRASSRHAIKSDAVDAGKDLAKNHKTDLYIHGKDNKIQDRDSYGNDPHPPKDRKH